MKRGASIERESERAVRRIDSYREKVKTLPRKRERKNDVVQNEKEQLRMRKIKKN